MIFMVRRDRVVVTTVRSPARHVHREMFGRPEFPSSSAERASDETDGADCCRLALTKPSEGLDMTNDARAAAAPSPFPLPARRAHGGARAPRRRRPLAAPRAASSARTTRRRTSGTRRRTRRTTSRWRRRSSRSR